jgi:serine phosphatase RsbU (regulator of sigma subunit)
MRLEMTWARFRSLSPRQRIAWLLRPKPVRWFLVFGVLAALTGWIWFLLPMVIYAVVRAVQWILERLLWSVRAKLGAFYLHAAVVPLLLFLTILLLLGYMVLWNISSRVVERRLLGLANWSEQRSWHAEQAWWQARAAGLDRQDAARRCLVAGWGSPPHEGLVLWVRQPDSGTLLATVGDPKQVEPLRADWLQQRRFAGLTTRGPQRDLELRSSVLLQDAAGDIEIGSALRVDGDIINAGLPDPSRDVLGDVGPPDRLLQGAAAPADTSVIARGILALYRIGETDSLAPVDTTSINNTGVGTTRVDRADIASRFPVLLGHYLGHPVDWRTGRTRDGGPDILIAFSIEAGVEALLSTSYEAETVVVWGALTIIATLLLLLVFATVRGLLYARSIAASVSKLDQGVRAIQRGEFGFHIEPRERDQLGALANGFNDMSTQLQGLLEERAAHRVVERELEIARGVQARLFPQEDPRDEHLEAVGVCVPARSVSGDYYDYVPIRGGWDLLVADVSGKGMSAALLMASLQASLRGQYGAAGETPPDPARALDHVNHHLGTYSEATRFVTLFLVRYDGSGELVYCNAGHNPALLLQDGSVQWLQEGGLMLGPFPDRPYTSQRVAVRPGDLICLYTDGVTEAMDPDSEQFGEERLAQLLQEQRDRPLRDIRQAVLDRVQAWRQGGAVTDDVTFVLLRILSARQ